MCMPIVWLEKSDRIQGHFNQRNKTNDNLYRFKMVTPIQDKWREIYHSEAKNYVILNINKNDIMLAYERQV